MRSSLFFLFIAVLLLGTLGLRPLYKADESRYAEIPREMVASGNWLTPRLNDFKYFEKPPLQYWATAVFFSLFGERDWAARLWTALAGIAGIVLVFFAGKRLFSSAAGTLGAAVLAGCPLYVLLVQINTLDMALTFFLSAAVFAFALGRYYVFWAACALAVLSKGLIGIVLPLGAIGLYILVRRDWSLLKKIKIFTGGALFLALSAPWFIAVSLANKEFAQFFFVQEHFQRFTTKMHGRYQPVWYFLPILAFGLAPWLLLLLAYLKDAFRKKASRDKAFDPVLFLGLWVVVVFLFFSVSGSKLPSYILPIFPALALLLGRWLAASQPRHLLVAQGVLAAAVGIALLAGAGFVARMLLDLDVATAAAYAAWLAGAGVLVALTSIAAIALAWERHNTAAVALLALGSFGCTLTALVGHRELAPAYSLARQAAAVPQGARVFAVDFYDHTLPWYLRRTVTMVRYKDELEVAIGWEPEKFVADLPAFRRAWAAEPRPYAVLSSREFENLWLQIKAPVTVVSRGPRYTIVRKP
jgi:4-amino-4-deoxy-L-arabinose transferase-like glycosyltransferase